MCLAVLDNRESASVAVVIAEISAKNKNFAQADFFSYICSWVLQ